MRMGDRRIILSNVERWCREPAGGLALIVVCLSVYLPGLTSIHPIDRDEARFAQASRQMFEAATLPEELKRPPLHDGGWAVPKVQDRPRLNKPPLIYWLQVASAWTCTGGDPLRDAIWMYRVPSVLSAIAAVLITWRIGLSMFDPRAAWLGAALLAIAPVVVFDAHQARADQLLLATVAAVQFYLWRAWRVARREQHPGIRDVGEPRPPGRFAWVGLWICVGLSILAKGPIGPMIAVLTAAALSIMTRQWAWILRLRLLRGALILVAMVGPWVWMVGQHVGWEKYLSIILDETVGRSLEAKEGHWAPPGYHTVLLAVLLWPGSLLTGLGVARFFGLAARGQAASEGSRTSRLRGWWRSRTPGRPSALFCLAWIVPAWVVFEVIGTKLPHYTLPMYPALALVSARMLLRALSLGPRQAFSGFDRLGFGAWWFMGICVSHAVAVGAGLIWLGSTGGTIGPLAVAAVIATAVAFAVWRLRPSEDPPISARRFAAMCLAWIACAGVSMGFVAEHMLPGTQTPRLIAAAKAAGGEAALIASEYHEDSVIFATRGAVRRLDRADIVDWFNQEGDRVAIVREGGAPFFAEESLPVPPYRAWARFAGSARGAWVVLTRDQPEAAGGAP